MKNGNVYDPIFDGKCEVCGKKIKKDIYKQGKCPYCGWLNCFLNEEQPNKVIYPNLVSLNKAKSLYKQGKYFEPNLDEFIEGLNFYGEMQFKYNGVYYEVDVIDDNGTKIRLYDNKTGATIIFDDEVDFKNNAKVDGKFLKDVWDKTSDRYWQQ